MLLVSVRNPAEARDAVSGGADIIDIKEPSRGPLGMADANTIADIADAVAHQTPTSAALGELTDGSHGMDGVDYFKVGLAHAPQNWRDKLIAFDRSRFVAVAYADHQRVAAPDPHAVLQWAIDHRCAAFLIDTAIKDGSNLFDHLEPAPLVEAALAANLTIALAGSLRGQSFARAAALNPTIIAVRGAACAHHNRTNTIDSQKVRALREVLVTLREGSQSQPAQSPATPV